MKNMLNKLVYCDYSFYIIKRFSFVYGLSLSIHKRMQSTISLQQIPSSGDATLLLKKLHSLCFQIRRAVRLIIDK